MAARVLLVLVAFTILFGCAQANTPIQKQEKNHGLEQATKKPATEVVHTVTEPAGSKPPAAPESTTPTTSAAPAMSSEQATLAEAYCRTVTYASKKDMSEQQLRTFINRTAEQSVKEMEHNRSLSAGAAGNEVLDELDVPRYPECEVRE
jgi:hypothetical protein